MLLLTTARTEQRVKPFSSSVLHLLLLICTFYAFSSAAASCCTLSASSDQVASLLPPAAKQHPPASRELISHTPPYSSTTFELGGTVDTSKMDVKVGQTVETTDKIRGTVRYVGEVVAASVRPGIYIGIELSTPTGKNDGSVHGQRFFTCPPLHGIFVPKAKVARVVAQPAARPNPTKSRVSSVALSATRPPSQTAVKPPTKAPAKPARPSSVGIVKPPTQAPIQSRRLSTQPPVKPPTALRPTRKPSLSGPAPPTRPVPSSSRSTTTTTSTASRPIRDTHASSTETEVQQLKKQLEHYRDQQTASNTVKAERDRFEGLIQKLQNKCQHYHQEVADLKATNKRQETELDQLSKDHEEHEADLELALLDKEMAEERAEQAMAERDAVKAFLEEQQLENEILKEEAELLSKDVSEDDKEAAGWYRLQKENDRLREAILYLKGIDEDKERDYKARLLELENSVVDAEKDREERDLLRERVTVQDATIEDLKQRLEAANEWEDIIEDLSDQNQQLKEQAAEKDAAIEHYAVLKELSDELEIQLVEERNEYQAELQVRDLQLAERDQADLAKDAHIADMELLVAKFRDLALDLQSKMMQTEAAKTWTEEQAKNTNARFNEVMDLNRRLHASHIENTNKTITTELQKLAANESKEELEIVKLYLSDTSSLYGNFSLRAYFASKRIAFKCTLAGSLFPAPISTEVQELEPLLDRLLVAESVHQLTITRLRGEQLTTAVSSASIEQYSSFSSAYQELGPVERDLDRFLESFKKDEVNSHDISESARGFARVFNVLAYVHGDALAGRPDSEFIFQVLSIESSCKLVLASFNVVKSCIQAVVPDDSAHGDLREMMLDRLGKTSQETLESISKARKLGQTLATLQQDSLYPEFPESLQNAEQDRELLARVADAAFEFAHYFLTLILEVRKDPNIPLISTSVSDMLDDSLSTHFPRDELRDIREVNHKLERWNEHASVLMNNVEIELPPAPWALKAKEVEEAKKEALETSKKLESLTAEHRTTLLRIREREEVIDTKELEIEHLRAKHREASVKSEEIGNLQKELTAARAELNRYKREIESKEAEILDLKDKIQFPPAPEPPEISSPAQPQAPAVTAKTGARKNTSAAFITFVQALSNENHWLRQREHSGMFGANLKSMFSRMQEHQAAQLRTESRRKEARAHEMLGMSMAMPASHLIQTPRRTAEADSFFDDDWTPDFKSTPLPPPSMAETPSRRRRGPIQLEPIQTALEWQSASDSVIAHLEDLSFIDLSPVAEEFATEALEGFSAIVL